MDSDSSIFSSSLYFSYNQFLVFDNSVATRPGVDWTEMHSKQGFARREKTVSFGTLLEFGHADVAVHLGSYEPKENHERVIEVPLEVPSGEVVIGGPEEFEDSRTVKLRPGHYRLVAAQTVIDDDHEAIDLFFKQVDDEPLSQSRIILADPGLHPPTVLLESAEVA